MSWRGTVVIECDSPRCYAEQAYEAAALAVAPLMVLAQRDGWLHDAKCRALCPQCREEQEAGRV